MRKWTMIALVIALALSGVGTAFAAGPNSAGSGAYAMAGQNAYAAAGPVAQAGVTIADVSVTTSPGLLPSLKDIQGTKYEDAVSRLMVMEVIDGYEDGTYRPANPVQRAEMAALIARAIDRGCFKVLLDPGFVDTEGHWAARGIAKTFNAGIVKGLSDTHFGPTLPVTYAQAMTMILRAIGYTDDGLGGTWPANYLAKAQELGLTSDLDPWTSDAPATRGNIALMLAPQAQAIRDYWAATEDEDQRPENGAGKLANFSGRAIGLPIAVASVLNEKGEAVDEIEFLMGDETYYLQTRKKGTVKEADFKNASAKFTGDLYALIMNDGIVREIKPADTAGLKRYVELTADAGDVGGFRKIQAHKNQRIDITGTGAAITNFAYAAKKEDVSIYEAVFKGNDLETFRSVTASAIDAGDYVRAWDLSADYAGVAVVLVLIDKGDFAAATAYGIL